MEINVPVQDVGNQHEFELTGDLASRAIARLYIDYVAGMARASGDMQLATTLRAFADKLRLDRAA